MTVIDRVVTTVAVVLLSLSTGLCALGINAMNDKIVQTREQCLRVLGEHEWRIIQIEGLFFDTQQEGERPDFDV